MKTSLFALIALFFIGCASKEQAKPAVEPPETNSDCEADEFRGFGVGEREDEALSEAQSALAKQINSSVKVISERTVNQQTYGREENLSSRYQSRTTTESTLQNAHDARIARKKQNGNKINIVVCMTRADAAKGFADRLRPVAASLEFSANAAIEAKHPVLKSEAWQKAQPLWSEFIPLYNTVEGLDKQKSAVYEPIRELYAKARDNYLNFCQTAKLYWNPDEPESNPYAEVAFAKLSSLNLVEDECKGNGISLIYKNTGYECRHTGTFRCSHKPALLISSCYGVKYDLLESPNVEVFQKVEEVGIRKLREKLEYEAFWGDWEKKIRKWIPVCE